MKIPITSALILAAVSLPNTLFGQTIISTANPTLTGVAVEQGTMTPVASASGSVISSGSYSFSTGSDLILGDQPVSETHGLYSNNTYNVGWTGQGAAQGQYSANNPADDPTGNSDFLSHLTDGTYGGDVPSQGGFASGGSGGAGSDAIYSLGNWAGGYDITSLSVYSGWQDSGRYDQAYSIEYSLASAPTVFKPLATLQDYTGNVSGVGAMTELTPTSGKYILTGVADVEFTFNPTENGWSGYRELVVNGVPLPEPSTWALLAGGVLVLAFVARRRALRS